MKRRLTASDAAAILHLHRIGVRRKVIAALMECSLGQVGRVLRQAREVL